jgi:hypothetical protein
MEMLLCSGHEWGVILGFLGIQDLASLSLCCRTLRDNTLQLLKPSKMDRVIQPNLGDNAVKFYILAGRLLVPLAERNPRWDIPLMCTHQRGFGFAAFLSYLFKGRVLTRPEGMNSSTREDPEHVKVFKGHGYEDDKQALRNWERHTKFAFVSKEKLWYNGWESFDFFTRELDFIEYQGDKITEPMRKKCLFYMYRSEFYAKMNHGERPVYL